MALTSSTVLLFGETGSGKEVLAQAIHDLSAQKDRAMIKVNCAVLRVGTVRPVKGAFTGALARQPGRFEIADGSTIFLDEVGELPLELQPKLLRVLQEGEFERLGGSKTIKVDARVIAATNRPLEQAVKGGTIPPGSILPAGRLSDRGAPAARTAGRHSAAVVFVKEFGNSMGKRIEEIADESMSTLQDYHWPGIYPRAAKRDRTSNDPFPGAEAAH